MIVLKIPWESNSRTCHGVVKCYHLGGTEANVGYFPEPNIPATPRCRPIHLDAEPELQCLFPNVCSFQPKICANTTWVTFMISWIVRPYDVKTPRNNPFVIDGSKYINKPRLLCMSFMIPDKFNPKDVPIASLTLMNWSLFDPKLWLRWEHFAPSLIDQKPHNRNQL